MERFEYPANPNAPPIPAWDGWLEAGENSADDALADDAAETDGYASRESFNEKLAEETRRSFEAGRERGHEEGRKSERDAIAPTAAADAERRRRQTAELAENLARERDRYFHDVEQEVVRLALAVATRILHREAQMDPLLLTGAVRVALGHLTATSEMRLRVPAQEADLWKETITLLPNLAAKPLVVAEESMRLGDCVIESKVGTVDLGIRAQLNEIERGFFDRAGTTVAPLQSTSDAAHENTALSGERR